MSELETVEAIEVVPDDFEARVARLLGLIESDPETRDRMMVEMYLALTDMERIMRTMMQSGGPVGLLKMMLGKNGS